MSSNESNKLMEILNQVDDFKDKLTDNQKSLIQGK